jgi:hypothetical protein
LGKPFDQADCSSEPLLFLLSFDLVAAAVRVDDLMGWFFY